MKDVSEKNFQTIGEAAASLVETGMRPTETGSEKPARWADPPYDPTDPRVALPRLIKPIVNEQSALLLSYLRFGKPTRTIVVDDLFTLRRLSSDFRQLSRFALPHEVIDTLTMIAGVIQVELPQEQGIEAYVALLQRLPPHVLKQAALEILMKHSYRTMPLPVEFLESPAAKAWADTVEWFDKLMPQWQARIRHELQLCKETTDAPNHPSDPPDLPPAAAHPARGGGA